MPDPDPPAAGARSPLPALRPGGQLIDRCGTEGVRRADHDAALVSAEELRELADRGRLPDAVDADHEHHCGTLGELERGVEFREVLFERLAQHPLEILRVCGAEAFHLLAELLDDALADVGTEIRRDERGLEVLPGRLVDGGLDEHAAQCATERPGLLRHESSLRVASGDDSRTRLRARRGKTRCRCLAACRQGRRDVRLLPGRILDRGSGPRSHRSTRRLGRC